ncbi:tetraacyldisaccharide 4'-kinase [Coralloluteibacterium stylophorae]|uniref:Tetraacyldisaccharide 4'-kinase n=1 Tax=Coralloluteibacterium stylophorae TaxID=1776034 RepID=A0A8J7VRI5_9GAMM|nr:tetraacyldisaccharide 4'-kinase [Coralloluteibacterium stylophorae]
MSRPLQSVWYGDTPPNAALRAVAGLYAGATGLRRWAYRHDWIRRQRVPVPVIVVGNLVAGGAGKTPLVIALVEWLRSRGRNPGVVSRGYGRKGAGALTVAADTPAAEAGDEPLLIARRTGAPVRVDADRFAGAQALVAAGCDILVADDGLQHYRLGRDLEIEVIDGARRYGNGRLLPAGPLREPLERAAACDFHVVNGEEAGAGEWPMRLELAGAQPLAAGMARPLSHFAGRRVHAVAGIGNPRRFFLALERAGITPLPHAFPDHHAFVREDFAFAEALPVLMTEKDAVKCAGFGLADLWAVPVAARLQKGFWDALATRLAVIEEDRQA